MPQLNPKQERFVHEYLVDLNPGAAYRRAGYQAKDAKTAATNAVHLMARPHVAEAIVDAKAARAQRLEVTADRVVRELARLAFSDPRSLYTSEGALKAIHLLDDDTAATVASVEVFEEYQGQGAARRHTGTLRKLKQWDKGGALDKLCRHLGLYRDRLELQGLTLEVAEVVVRTRTEAQAALRAMAEATGVPGLPGDHQGLRGRPGSGQEQGGSL